METIADAEHVKDGVMHSAVPENASPEAHDHLQAGHPAEYAPPEPTTENDPTTLEGKFEEISDVRTALENALENTDLDFTGTYYHHAIYAAINPILRVEQVGRIGLPLSEPEAKRIIAHSKQAPFGQGERTLVDTEVRDTWEIDAANVQFDNPAWAGFIDAVVQNACKSLGVDVATSKPRCELHKLLLYETGSHFLPHQDTEKAPGMFATVIVVLQSPFTGGEVGLSHGGLSTIIDSSSQSLLATTAIAWYTDVVHEVKPITGGYRLALSYNLIHTTTTLRPSLPSTHHAAIQLRNIFLTWRSQGHAGLQKIIYLLDHQYSQANLRGSALKGSDSHQIALLNVVARECGFRLGLASIESHVKGTADDEEGPPREKKRNFEFASRYPDWYDYEGESPDEDDWQSKPSEDDRDPFDFDMDEVTEAEMTITNLVDLDGRHIADELECEDCSGETIPVDLQDQVENGPVDEAEYEGYQGNEAGTLEQWYRRTALVIWPDFRHDEIVYGDAYPEHVAELLQDGNTSQPTHEDLSLVDYLLTLHPNVMPPWKVARAVCGAACRWGDSALWAEAFDLCGCEKDIAQLDFDGLGWAAVALAPDVTLPRLAAVLKNDPSNLRRCTLLDEIESQVPRDHPDFAPWLAQQRDLLLATLRPLVATDAHPVIFLARRQGGIDRLNESVLPRLRDNAEPSTIANFATSLYENLQTFGDDAARVRAVVTELLALGISKSDFYALPPGAPPPKGTYVLAHEKVVPKLSPSAALFHIQTCIRTENAALVETIVDKLTSRSGLTPAIAVQRATTVLLPLVGLVQPLVAEGPTEIPGLQKLYRSAVSNALAELPERKYTDAELCAVLDVAFTIGDGTDMLVRQIVPTISASASNVDNIVYVARQIKTRLASTEPQPDIPVAVPPLIEVLAAAAVRKSKVDVLSAYDIEELLSFCLENGYSRGCEALLKQVTDEKLMKTDHINNCLLPLFRSLPSLLKKHAIDLSTNSYASFFKAVIFAWTRKILGPKPADGSAHVPPVVQKLAKLCQCRQCKDIVDFFQYSLNKDLRLEGVGAAVSKHLESRMLACGASVIAKWRTVQSKPRTFTVTRLDPIWKPIQWKSRADEGIQLLRCIGDDQVLRRVFGDQSYVRLCQGLGRTPVPAIPAQGPPAPPPTQATATASNPQPMTPHVRPRSPLTSIVPNGEGPREPAVKKRRIDFEGIEIVDLTSP